MFMPPSFQIVDVLVLGSHGDLILIILIALGWLFAMSRQHAASAMQVLVLGLICGFGLFFSMQFIVVLPALLTSWLVIDNRFFRRKSFLWFLLGLVVMVAPIAFFLPSADIALNVDRRPEHWFLTDGIGGAASQLVEGITISVPAAWLFDSYGGPVCRWLYAVSLVGALLCVIPRLRRKEPLAIFLTGYPLLWLCAYSLTNFELNPSDHLSGMGVRFLMPVQACCAALIALAVQALAERRRGWLARLILMPAVLAGAAGVFALTDLGPLFTQPSAKGTRFVYFANHVGKASEGDFEKHLEWSERLDPGWRASRALSYCHQLKLNLGKGDLTLPRLKAQLERIRNSPPPVRQAQLCVIGTRLTPELVHELDGVDIDQESLAWLVRAAGFSWRIPVRNKQTGQLAPLERATYLSLESLPDDLACFAAEGMGYWLGMRLSPYDRVSRLMLELAFPSEQTERCFYRGLGWGYRWRYIEEGYTPPTDLKVEALLTESQRASFREGLVHPER